MFEIYDLINIQGHDVKSDFFFNKWATLIHVLGDRLQISWDLLYRHRTELCWALVGLGLKMGFLGSGFGILTWFGYGIGFDAAFLGSASLALLHQMLPSFDQWLQLNAPPEPAVSMEALHVPEPFDASAHAAEQQHIIDSINQAFPDAPPVTNFADAARRLLENLQEPS